MLLSRNFGEAKEISTSVKNATCKGTFYSESAGEMWNRHIKVPKIVPGLLFPERNMNCDNIIIFLTFFYVYKINVFKTKINMYQGFNQ